jgi:hypothetical protein
MSELQEKPSPLKKDHQAPQNIKFIYFFLCLLFIFALLDPDPDCESGSGYGSRGPNESGSTKHCFKALRTDLYLYLPMSFIMFQRNPCHCSPLPPAPA